MAAKPRDSEPKSDADKRWNVPRCAAEIRALQGQVAALGNGSTPHSLPVSASPAAPTFENWLPDALVAYLGSAGPSIVGPGSIADTLDAMGNVWLTHLLASGASDDEVQAFAQTKQGLYQRALNWLSVTKGERFDRIRQRQERDGNTDITKVGGPGEDQIDPQKMKEFQAMFAQLMGAGQAQPQQQAPSPLSAAEQSILDARTGGMPTR